MIWMLNELLVLLILLILFFIDNRRNRVGLEYSVLIVHLDLIIDNYKKCVVDQEIIKLSQLYNTNKDSQFNSITKLHNEYDNVSKRAIENIIENLITKEFRRECLKFFTEDGLILYITKKMRE